MLQPGIRASRTLYGSERPSGRRCAPMAAAVAAAVRRRDERNAANGDDASEVGRNLTKSTVLPEDGFCG